MSDPPSQSGVRGWHQRIEHYTPDGTIGRFLFGVVAGLGLGGFLFFAGIVQVLGPTSALLLSELVGLVSIPVGAVLMIVSLVVLWPVYLSLIGNLDSASDYEIGNTHRSKSPTSRTRDRSDGTGPIEALKRRYASGEISHEEFERRLDDIVNAGTPRNARPNRGTADLNTESETE